MLASSWDPRLAAGMAPETASINGPLNSANVAKAQTVFDNARVPKSPRRILAALSTESSAKSGAWSTAKVAKAHAVPWDGREG